MLLLGTLLVLAGCGAPSAGSIRAVSLGDEPVTFITRFRTACYAFRPGAETSFLLTDVPDDALIRGDVDDGQVLHVDLLWEPRPGRTPMDPSATNAVIRLVIVSRGEVGVYEGGGFVLPSRSPGESAVTLEIKDASLRLLESTAGFVDPLTPARMEGEFTAGRDDERAHRIRLAASQLVTNALGRSRYVRASDLAPPPLLRGMAQR